MQNTSAGPFFFPCVRGGWFGGGGEVVENVGRAIEGGWGGEVWGLSIVAARYSNVT